MTKPATLYPVWVHRLVFPFRHGKLAAGLLIFTVMWLLLNEGAKSGELGVYSKLFFAAMCAYIVPVFSLIIERSVTAFDDIEGSLDASAEQCQRWRRELTHRSFRWFCLVSAIALFLGVRNILFMQTPDDRGLVDDILSGQGDYMTYFATLLIWVTMTTAITALLNNARLFARLGRDHLRIDLLHSPAVLPIARVAVMSTLSIIGAQVLFALLLLDGDASSGSILPGFVALALPLLALFVIPVWPLRQRLRAAKQAELATINQQLDHLRPEGVTRFEDESSLDKINRLLLYRREIQQVSEWPFDMPALMWLALYLILPPLTWVGAALIENLVDTLL
jgi:hypothetical protein